jgi:uncharacterized protein YjlB
MKTQTYVFADDGDIPNNRLPLLVYVGAIDLSAADKAVAFEELFHRHGWGNGWRSVVFPFHHYHSNAHEVLGLARGEVTLRMGGEAGGRTITARAGDALLIPAGVGHKRLSSAEGLLVVGAYPAGSPDFDLLREGAEDKVRIRARIAAVAIPATDPVGGKNGGVQKYWE